MTDRTTLSVPPIHLPLIHSENVFVDHFFQIHHTAKSYIYSSGLSALISNPAVLARVERNPLLRAAILSNPFLAEEISHSPRLLNILIQNPSLISSILANPKLLTLVKQNLHIVSEIIKNSDLSVEAISKKLFEMKPNLVTKDENIQINKKPHRLEKSIIAAEKIRPAMHNAKGKINPEIIKPLQTQKQQFLNYLAQDIFK